MPVTMWPGSRDGLDLFDVGAGERFTVRPAQLVVAGYTGRDSRNVQAHIDELAAIGVPPPATVPTFFHLDPALVTTADSVSMGSATTSGEAEPVLVRHRGRYFLGVGSDHTDRELERSDVEQSKAICTKPIGSRVVPLTGELGGGGGGWDWDEVRAQCTVDGIRYQDGRLIELRPPADLVARLQRSGGDRGEDLVLFCGTFPLLGGEFIYGRQWHIELAIRDQWTLGHTYRVEVR